MKEWAKLFVINGRQVLFYLEPDGDDMWLHQCMQTKDNGMHIDMKLIFPNDKKDNSRKVFDAIDQAAAERLNVKFDEMLADVSEEVTDEEVEAEIANA